MRQGKRTILLGAVLAGIAGVTFADSTPADVNAQMDSIKAEMAQLRAQNAEMKAQVAQLKTSSNDYWLNEQRTEEVKAIVRDVMSDADTRASLQGTGATSGYNKGFFIASEDGKFLLRVGALTQLRYAASFRESPPAGSPNPSNGFEVRRFEPGISGYVGDPRFEYTLILQADKSTDNVTLKEAWVNYKLTDELSLTGGRFKPLFSHEENVSSGKQMAVERTTVNNYFSIGHTQGLQLAYTTDDFRVTIGANNGVRAGEATASAIPAGSQPLVAPTGGANAYNQDNALDAITSRVDYKLEGEWKQWGDFADWSDDEAFLTVGGGAHYQKDNNGTNEAAGKGDFILWTADIMSHAGGLSVYSAGYGFTTLSGSKNGGTTVNSFAEPDYNDYGTVTQFSYQVVPDKFEPFFRWEIILPDDRHYAQNTSPNSDATLVRVVTAGANYYFRKHDAKVTLDVMWSPDTISAQTAGGVTGAVYSGADWSPDTYNTSRNQVVVRAQFQLLF